ncbi:tetratricopeptide repeat protein [Myxococcus sp. K15C18031901]|uniref:tetratricopeptide repeat protein n=1 Tax=Myxococcus dinghuensis TaxID=2906761 RepID=UPI0020A7207F|nr:tetratricopeptide repeat protein [Myxococcus dinghuensis]MCP3100403.1 tetratricopeptide repeat protein [Myxococcus dinghuensis]
MLHALPLLVLALTATPPPPSARNLNTEGFRLYQEGRYPEALEKFQAAARDAPDYALARYNVAATLGVLRKQGRVCEFGAHRDVIVEHLTQAVERDARRLTRARQDPDLDPIRDTLGWQRLLGRTPERETDVPALLRAVSWFGPGVGVHGSTTGLRFLSRGRVRLWTLAVDENGQARRTETPGTYAVRGRTVVLTVEGQPRREGTLGEAGALAFPGLGTFTDSPAECDA